MGGWAWKWVGGWAWKWVDGWTWKWVGRVDGSEWKWKWVVVAAAADQDPDGWCVPIALEFVVDERHVEAELACILGLELPRLQLNDDVAQLLHVEEQEVEVKIITAHFQLNPPANKGKARAQLKEKALHMIHQGLLHFRPRGGDRAL